MTHLSQLAELKPLLRNNAFLDLDEYALLKTKQEGWVCSFLGMRLGSVFQPIYRLNGVVHGREALLRATIFEHGELLQMPHLTKLVMKTNWCYLIA